MGRCRRRRFRIFWRTRLRWRRRRFWLVRRFGKGAPGNYFAVFEDDFGADVIARAVVGGKVAFEVNAAAAMADFAIGPVAIFLEDGAEVAPEGEVALLGIFAFENFTRLTPRDVDGIGGHADANLAGVDHGFLVGGE